MCQSMRYWQTKTGLDLITGRWFTGYQAKTRMFLEVETAFYNADKLGEMMVVVEAISLDGRIGYQEYTYEVEKRNR